MLAEVEEEHHVVEAQLGSSSSRSKVQQNPLDHQK